MADINRVTEFKIELFLLHDDKLPTSRTQISRLTGLAVEAVEFHEDIVQNVEKFIQECKPEYKVTGLYLINAILRESRKKFGIDQDVFTRSFAKNMQTTFRNLIKCPTKDKRNVIRVLKIWFKNAIFPPEVIELLVDLADPNHPTHKEQTANNDGTLNTTSASNFSSSIAVTKTPPSCGVENTPKDQKIFSSKLSIDPATLAQTKMETANIANANDLMGQRGETDQVKVSCLARLLPDLRQILFKMQEAAANESQSSVFDKKLLDYDYGEEEEDDDCLIIGSSPAATQSSLGQHNSGAPGGGLEGLGTLLVNPEVIKQLQTLQQTMQGNNYTATSEHEMEEQMRKSQQMKQEEDEFDKHLTQFVPSLRYASECELKPSDIQKTVIYTPSGNMSMNAGIMHQDMREPPPGNAPLMPYASQPPQASLRNVKSPLMDERQDVLHFPSSAPAIRDSIGIVNYENLRSQNGSPDRYGRRSRSSSPWHGDRDGNRERDEDGDRKFRSRGRSRHRRSRSRDGDRERQRDESRDKMSEEEREKQRERGRRGLPPIVRDKLSVCSTTLWASHLSKLVHRKELSDTFGEFGDIVSIDLISPRGCAHVCMNRRQDAYRALTKLQCHKMQGQAITLAWAPSKGVKGKEWKDYWEVELGVSYIPWNKLNNVTDQDLELLEDGGMIDEDTLPPSLKGRLAHAVSNTETLPYQLHLRQQALTAFVGGTPTHFELQMIPPAFPIISTTRILGPMGLQMAHGLMPNVPIGVPPPNMGLIGRDMMQRMLTTTVNSSFGAGVGVGLLAQIPLPAPAAPLDKPSTTGMRPPFDPPIRPPFGVLDPRVGGPNGPRRSLENDSSGSSSSNFWPLGETENELSEQIGSIEDRDHVKNQVLNKDNCVTPGGKDRHDNRSRNNNRSRKSRWGNLSPPPADHTFNEEPPTFVEDNKTLDTLSR